jgi:hypothetical protein
MAIGVFTKQFRQAVKKNNTNQMLTLIFLDLITKMVLEKN